MSTQPKHYLTPAEYLAIERCADTRSEYYQGEMFAMAGGSKAHNQIAHNIERRLGNQLADRDCVVYSSDMRVRIPATTLYTYPDVVSACDPLEFEDEGTDTLLNPRLIAEVLSKSTADYDRGAKAEMYRQIPSLSEYLLVAQNRLHVEHYVRQTDGSWRLTEHDDTSDALRLESIDCCVSVAEIYEKVKFEESDS